MNKRVWADINCILSSAGWWYTGMGRSYGRSKIRKWFEIDFFELTGLKKGVIDQAARFRWEKSAAETVIAHEKNLTG